LVLIVSSLSHLLGRVSLSFSESLYHHLSSVSLLCLLSCCGSVFLWTFLCRRGRFSRRRGVVMRFPSIFLTYLYSSLPIHTFTVLASRPSQHRAGFRQSARVLFPFPHIRCKYLFFISFPLSSPYCFLFFQFYSIPPYPFYTLYIVTSCNRSGMNFKFARSRTRSNLFPAMTASSILQPAA